jgi:hypothetical protein
MAIQIFNVIVAHDERTNEEGNGEKEGGAA